jgi:hypothetical protein
VNDNIEALNRFSDAVVDNILELNAFKLAVAASNELLIYFILVSNEAEFTNVDAVKFNTEELNEFIDAVVLRIEALNACNEEVVLLNTEADVYKVLSKEPSPFTKSAAVAPLVTNLEAVTCKLISKEPVI